MATLWELAAKQRAQLVRADAEVALRLTDQYRPVAAALEAQLERILLRMDRAIAAGDPIGPAMLYQEGRARELLAQMEARIAAFTKAAEGRIAAAGRRAAGEGLAAGQQLVDAATPPGWSASFTSLRPDALDAAASGARAVSGALAGLPAGAPALLEATLVDAVGRGLHPREAAATLRRQIGMPLTRALTIARTEQLRAYRTGSTLTYQASAEALRGWVWLSAADSRTCAACWAMHGTTHTLDESMESHPNCRCTPVPWVRPWSELGLDDDSTPQLPVEGERAFRRLPRTDQRRILGVGGEVLYRRGDVELRDFLATRHHPLYGQSIGRASLQQAQANAQMR